MFKGFKRAAVGAAALVLLSGTVLAGCGSKSGSGGDQVFRMNLNSEPPSLDPGQVQDNQSSTVVDAIMDGLTRKDGKTGETQPAIAEKWDISQDGLTYTFHLRKDAKWTNGDPVKASDFEFAWKRVLDPNFNPPAPYAYQLYYLKNAEGYNTKKVTDAAQVGVKAKDDYTLEVQLEQPTPYFLSLTSFYTYFPVNEKAVKANPKMYAEANTMVTNGAFYVKEWKHNDTIVLAKNDKYYDAKSIKFSGVQMTMVKDAGTELNMYNTNQLDWAGRPTGEIPTDQIPKLKADKNANLQIKGIASSYYYVFNTTAKPFDNVNIRKALSMAINRQEIVDKVTLANQIPAFGFVPPGIQGEKQEFRKEVDGNYFKEDNAKAKELLAQGLKEENLDKFPEITLIHNTGEGHKKIAQAIVDMWKTNLGITVKVEQQEWGVFLKNRTNLNYQVARAGWGADYNDPMTYIDLWTSTSGNNDSGWKSADYDKLVKEAYATLDQSKRMKAMASAEKMLMDNSVIMPIYYYTGVWMQKPYVKDVFIDYKGDIDYSRGYFEKK